MEFIAKFEKLKKKLSKVDSSKFTSDFAIQVNMTDDDCGGAFYIAYINNTFSVEPYDYHDHTLMLTLASADFEKIIDKKLDVDKAVEDNKMNAHGDVSQIKAVAEAIVKPVRKTASKEKIVSGDLSTVKKKTAPKKTAPKKTTAKKSVGEKKTTSKSK